MFKHLFFFVAAFALQCASASVSVGNMKCGDTAISLGMSWANVKTACGTNFIKTVSYEKAGKIFRSEYVYKIADTFVMVSVKKDKVSSLTVYKNSFDYSLVDIKCGDATINVGMPWANVQAACGTDFDQIIHYKAFGNLIETEYVYKIADTVVIMTVMEDKVSALSIVYSFDQSVS